MDFRTIVWIYQVTGMIMTTSATVTYPSSPIRASPGETAEFKWDSNVTILEVTWGIRSRSNINLAHPQFIVVRSFDENPVISNDISDADLKNRINYTGNLTAGHAWFTLSNVNLNDSNWYITRIREDDGSGTGAYYIQLIVEVQPTTQAPTFSTKTTSSASGLSNGIITIIVLFAIIFVMKRLRN